MTGVSRRSVARSRYTGTPSTGSRPNFWAIAFHFPARSHRVSPTVCSAEYPCRDLLPTGRPPLVLRPEQLVATVVSDSERLDRVGTVIATDFLGHDVLLTIDPAGDTPPIIVRQHSLNPPPIDAKVRIEVVGNGVVAHMSRLLDHLRAYGENVAVLTDTPAAVVPPTRRHRRPTPRESSAGLVAWY